MSKIPAIVPAVNHQTGIKEVIVGEQVPGSCAELFSSALPQKYRQFVKCFVSCAFGDDISVQLERTLCSYIFIPAAAINIALPQLPNTYGKSTQDTYRFRYIKPIQVPTRPH